MYFRQQMLCKTLAGNDCPLLTITSLEQENENRQIPIREWSNIDNERNQKLVIRWIVLSRVIDERTYVILTSRVHPGESNASWVMKGIIDYLLSDEPTARILRDRFIFKVMIFIDQQSNHHSNYSRSSQCWIPMVSSTDGKSHRN